MRRSSGWRSALAVTACCIAASSWAISTPPAGAQTTEEDLTLKEFMDLAGLDLISQSVATPASPAVIRLRIADELSTAALRARLYAPVTTRAELLASLYGPPSTPLITEWTVEDARITATDDQGVVLSVPIQPPDEDLTGTAIFDDGRPLPLHLEVIQRQRRRRTSAGHFPGSGCGCRSRRSCASADSCCGSRPASAPVSPRRRWRGH